jgi:uncharacterized protein
MPIDPEIRVDRRAVEDFCRRHGIRSLAVFGSASRGDLGPASDVDLLVELEPGPTVKKRSPELLRALPSDR